MAADWWAQRAGSLLGTTCAKSKEGRKQDPMRRACDAAERARGRQESLGHAAAGDGAPERPYQKQPSPRRPQVPTTQQRRSLGLKALVGL